MRQEQPLPTNHWGMRLAKLLRRNSMNQSALAQRLGVSSMTVSKWMKGGGASDENLEAICSILGATPAWLKWGEDVFTDATWLEATDKGGDFARRLMNGNSRLDLSTTIEAAMGFVLWMWDDETSSWIWSGNAHKVFGLHSAREANQPLNVQIDNVMDKDGLSAVHRLFKDMREGCRLSGWVIYTLRHLPKIKFFHVARSIPGARSARRVCGFTISSAGTLGAACVNWNGPMSCYEAENGQGFALVNFSRSIG